MQGPAVFYFDGDDLTPNMYGHAAEFPEAIWEKEIYVPADFTLVIPAPVFFEYETNLCLAFKEIFYNRIHFTPKPFDMGTVVADAIHTVSVWNAYENTAHELQLVTVGPSPDGTTLETELPVNFLPLQAIPVDFLVKGLGQLSLVGLITFEFAGDLIALLPTAGSRSALYYWAHNWAAPIVEKLRWETEILGAETGREQRRQKRQNPVRKLAQHYTLEGGEWQKLQRAVWRDQRSRLITRIDSEAAELTAAVVINDDILPFDPKGYDFDAGMAVMIAADDASYETGVIDQVLPGTGLLLTNGLSRAWGANTQVFPLRRGFLGSDVQLQGATLAVGDAVLEYLITNEQVSSNRWAAPEWPSYRNLPLIMAEDLSGERPGYSLEMTEEIQDTGIGAYDKDNIKPRPATSFPMRWLCFGREEIGQMLAFLNYCKGRCYPFWWFNWAPDFQLAADIAENVSQIAVANWDYISTYGADTSRRDVLIRLHNGAIYPRRIVEAVPGLTLETERISLDAAIPVAVPISAVDRIGFLRYCRMGIDEVEIEWRTRDCAILKTTFRQLEVSE